MATANEVDRNRSKQMATINDVDHNRSKQMIATANDVDRNRSRIVTEDTASDKPPSDKQQPQLPPAVPHRYQLTSRGSKDNRVLPDIRTKPSV